MKRIDSRSKKRADLSFRCLPFNSSFYSDVKQSGLNAETVFEKSSQYRLSEAGWFNHSDDIEAIFRWLIKIGILRREVDGQGLTAKVRLTPLGRQILDNAPSLPSQKAGLFEKLSHWIIRQWHF